MRDLSSISAQPLALFAPLDGAVLRADDLVQRTSETYGLTVNAWGELVVSRGAEVSGL